MNLFNNIKVDVYGQFHNDTVHAYTYPTRFNAADMVNTEWLRPIDDPRVVRDKLLTTAPQVYALYNDANGVYYSLITPNLKDSRNGYVAVTMFVAAGSPKMRGAVVVKALDALKRELVDNGSYTNQMVEQTLMQCGVPQFTGMPRQIAKQPANTRPNAYRLYMSPAELESILDNPQQTVYGSYHSVYVVAHDYAPQSTAMELINRPIEKEYTVNMVATNCTFTGKTVRDGQRITLQFTRDGFKPAQLQFNVTEGNPAPGVTVANGVMTVTEPAGIQWQPGPSRPVTTAAKPQQPRGGETFKAMEKQSLMKQYPWLMYAIVAFAAALVAGLVVFALMPGDNSDNQSVQEASVVESGASGDNEIANDPKEDKLYADDIEYMRKNEKTWKIADIKSQKGKRVISLLQSGDIDGLAGCEYYVDNRDNGKINSNFQKAIDYLRGLSGDKRELAQRYMRDQSSGSNVNVYGLLCNAEEIHKGILTTYKPIGRRDAAGSGNSSNKPASDKKDGGKKPQNSAETTIKQTQTVNNQTQQSNSKTSSNNKNIRQQAQNDQEKK